MCLAEIQIRQQELQMKERLQLKKFDLKEKWIDSHKEFEMYKIDNEYKLKLELAKIQQTL